MTEELIPGIVALGCAFLLLIRRDRIEKSILYAHEEFWIKRLGLHGRIGRFGEWLLKATILFIGIGCLFCGLILLYRYISRIT